MRLWKIAPLDLSDPRWKHWNPKPICVRAANEVAARRLAESVTAIALPVQKHKPIPINPWAEGGATMCEDVSAQSNEYSVEGPPEVLNRSDP
jgi:hypothetical protein